MTQICKSLGLPDSVVATWFISRDPRHACSLLHEKMSRSERIPDSTGVRDGNATDSNLGHPRPSDQQQPRT
jgi:hypothetical protein